MRRKGANPDALAAEIAARQHGAVTIAQLLSAGLTEAGVRRRVQAGRLHWVHRGVYAVGHAGLSHEGRWMAAVLACGPRAVLSHRSAAELWELLRPTNGTVSVTVATAAGRKPQRGIRLHRSPSLPNTATTNHRGIAVTTPARTLADLRRVVEPEVYRRALRQAEYRGMPLGATKTDRTRSELETKFLRLCRRHRLPLPAVNVRVGSFTVDFVWSEQRLVVETDGYRAHRGRQAFEDDRARELELRALGYRVRRFSASQVERQPSALAAAIAAALGGSDSH